MSYMEFSKEDDTHAAANEELKRQAQERKDAKEGTKDKPKPGNSGQAQRALAALVVGLGLSAYALLPAHAAPVLGAIATPVPTPAQTDVNWRGHGTTFDGEPVVLDDMSDCTIYAFKGKVWLHNMRPGEVRYSYYGVYKGRVFKPGYYQIGTVTNEGARHWAATTANNRGAVLCTG